MICPLLSVCKKQVDLDTYRNVCTNVAKDAYKDCDEYKRIASSQRPPSAWMSLFIPTTP